MSSKGREVIRIGRDFATENLVPGQSVYGERLRRRSGREFRLWDAKRSKIAAAMQKGMRVPFDPKWDVLYLGVASGTTASHLSDIIREGMIFGVDPAPRVLREFLLLSETRSNLVPLLKDANRPESYRDVVPDVDFLYQDVAQPNQAQILMKNARTYLKKGGLAFVAVKSRSIDVTANPRDVFARFKRELQGFDIIAEKRLEPFEKDHLALLLRKK
jgi:fibrillarin-like pre-rRNA processing protein